MFLALTRQHRTFLSTEDWTTIPWKLHPKTWRDKLYDLVLRFSNVLAGCSGHDQASTVCGSTRTLIDEALQIEASLSMWRSSWLEEAYPSLYVNRECGCPAPFSCICPVSLAELPAAEFALLRVECWALQLLISTTLHKLSANEADLAASWQTTYLHLRSSLVADYMERAITCSVVNVNQSVGITEGFCRTILSTWAVRVHKDTRDIQ